tara:strand:- start:491 stop:1234 length:744 start_codon:yes stop_codon:yes gene_type:complete
MFKGGGLYPLMPQEETNLDEFVDSEPGTKEKEKDKTKLCIECRRTEINEEDPYWEFVEGLVCETCLLDNEQLRHAYSIKPETEPGEDVTSNTEQDMLAVLHRAGRRSREREKDEPEPELKLSHRARITMEVKSPEIETRAIVSGINKMNVEQILRADLPEETTMPLWKEGKLTGSVIKKVWDMIDRNLICRVANGWKIKPKPGYNVTTYWINLNGDCSCQGYKVRGACSHALAVDVFVKLNQMGCAE